MAMRQMDTERMAYRSPSWRLIDTKRMWIDVNQGKEGIKYPRLQRINRSGLPPGKAVVEDGEKKKFERNGIEAQNQGRMKILAGWSFSKSLQRPGKFGGVQRHNCARYAAPFLSGTSAIKVLATDLRSQIPTLRNRGPPLLGKKFETPSPPRLPPPLLPLRPG